MAHRAAAAKFQGLLDLLPLQVVFHLPGLGVGVIEHFAVGLDPGDAEVFCLHGFEEFQPALLRSGGGNAQLVLQLGGLDIVGVAIEGAHDEQQRAE